MPHLLVIKTCCLGDVLMTTPLIAALRDHYPDARLDVVVGAWSRRVLEHNPAIDNLVDCGPLGAGHYSLSDYLALVRTLRSKSYDVCLVLERSPLLSVLPFLAHIPIRAGIDSFGRGFSLTKRVPANLLRHEVELYLDVGRIVGAQASEPKLRFFASTCERESAREKLASELGVAENKVGPIVAIHPGGGANPGMTLEAKRWSPERFACVADRAVAAYRARVVLVGSHTDSSLVAEVKRHMKCQAFDLCGKLSLGELAALYERCDLAIANDTGAMHLAAAVGTAVVAIFGPTSPHMYGPYGSEHSSVWQPVGCNPCLLYGRFDRTCRSKKCIDAVSVDMVWQQVSLKLDKRATG
jgi:lipopolysaccharide heptosyltransferase II